MEYDGTLSAKVFTAFLTLFVFASTLVAFAFSIDPSKVSLEDLMLNIAANLYAVTLYELVFTWVGLSRF